MVGVPNMSLLKSLRRQGPLQQSSQKMSKLSEIESRVESLEETIDLVADKKVLLQIKRALDDVKRGRYRDYDSVEQIKANIG